MLRTPTLRSRLALRSLLALIVVLGLAPGAAPALGLGGMRTQSALNQPFYAELDLFDVGTDELDTVKVRLASRDEFEKAGAERPHFLTRLQFTPMIGASGQPIVQITSREPIREPYLDFLVEVLWPGGRLVKEYTVLMDPPATRGRGAPSVSQPRAAAPTRRPPPQQVTRPSAPPPPPLRSRPEPEPEPAPVARSSPSPKPATAARPQPVPAEAAGTSFPLHYGPVPSGTGLWRIARQIAPPGATVPQTAMALYRNNQDAFVRGDINLLKVDADLYVPTAAELFALDASTANQQFQDAMAGRSVPDAPITDITAQPQLRIADAPRDGESQPAAQQEGRASAAPPESIGELEEDLLRVRETSESNRQETTELRDRIHELETQLTDIRRLLELRNEQLAQLQQELGAPGAPEALPLDLPRTAESAQPAAASDVAPPEPVVDPEIASAAPADAPRELLPPAIPPDLPDEVRAAIEAEEQALAEAQQAATPQAASEQAWEQSAPAAPPVTEQPPDPVPKPAASPGAVSTAAASAPEPDGPAASGGASGPGFLAGMMQAVPLWAIAAGAGVIVVGGLGLLAYRRRQQLAETEPEGLVTSGVDAADMPAAVPAAVAAGAAGTQVVPDEDSLSIELGSLPASSAAMAPPLPEESGPSLDVQTGLPINVASNIPRGGTAETQEADILAEADIYILYGRYREAESILQEELQQAPDRADLRYKLAEALIGSGNREELAALVERMKAAGEDKEDAAKWAAIEQGLAAMKPAAGDQATRLPKTPSIRPGAVRRPAAREPSLRTLDLGDPGKAGLDSEELGDSEDGGLGFSVREVTPSSAEKLQAEMDKLELDLKDLDNLGDLERDSRAAGGDPAAGAAGDVQPLSLDLPREPKAAAPRRASAQPPSEPSLSTELGDDLDLDLDALEKLANLDDSTQPPDLSRPAFELDELETPEPVSEPVAPRERSVEGRPPATPAGHESAAARSREAAPAPPADDERELVDDSISSDVLSSQWRMDSGLWDEAATKMDLARAYVEMEDPDAARAILEEVAQEGNEAQQAEAKAMLAKLD